MPVPEDWALPQAIRVRLGETVGRQRSMIADGHLLVILHKVPRIHSDQREGAYFWRHPTGEWQSFTEGGGASASTVPNISAQALAQHLETYDTAIDHFERAFDPAHDVEDQFPLLRQVVRVHRAMKNACHALQMAREGIREDRTIITLRDRAGDIERAAELLHSDIDNALDFAVAQRAEEQAIVSNQLNAAGHRLNLLAAVFLPLTAIASVFGMNIGSGVVDDSPFLFWVIVGVGLALGAILGITMPSPHKSRHHSNNRRPPAERPAPQLRAIPPRPARRIEANHKDTKAQRHEGRQKSRGA